MTFKLTKEQEELLKIGHWVQIKKEDSEDMEHWFYFPYWIKKNDNETFEMVKFEQLPERLIKLVENDR